MTSIYLSPDYDNCDVKKGHSVFKYGALANIELSGEIRRLWKTWRWEPSECIGIDWLDEYVSDFQPDDLEKIWDDVKEFVTPREYKILYMRYAMELTLEETAKIFEISRSRIGQIEGRALRRLKRAAFSDKWKVYR